MASLAEQLQEAWNRKAGQPQAVDKNKAKPEQGKKPSVPGWDGPFTDRLNPGKRTPTLM